MAAENHNGGRSPSVDPTKVDHSLDDLAKGLAGGTISRREAVRLVGATLLGGALASVPGFAWAQQGPGPDVAAGHAPASAACENYCTRVFPAGPERAQCIRQGAQGRGPCYECNVALGVWPPAGPHFDCPPDQVFDPNPETGTCCRSCGPGAVLCTQDGFKDCYSLQYRCGYGGTLDPSTCQCICPPGTVQRSDGFHCSDLKTDSRHCGQCGNNCPGGDATPCVNGVCLEAGTTTYGCCVCSDPANPEFGAQSCSPYVRSAEECCDACKSHPSGFRQCNFVNGTTPFTCGGGPTAVCIPT